MNYRRVFIKNGLVFLTIVTNDRIPILTDNIKLLNQSYNNVIKYYKFDLIAYSILPEHIHCIIKPTIIEEYSKIVKSFKYSFTKINPYLVMLYLLKYQNDLLGMHNTLQHQS